MSDLQATIKRLRDIQEGPFAPFEGDEIDWVDEVSDAVPVLLDALESAIEVMEKMSGQRWQDPETCRDSYPAYEWLEKNGISR